MVRATVGITGLLILLCGGSWGAGRPLPTDAAQLVRESVQNEIKAADATRHYMFRGTKTTPRGSTTKIYVQTTEATAGVAIAYDGKPLTADQQRDEQNRVERFLKNPDEMRKKRAQEREDADRTMRIIKALPDAFFYEYAGEEKGSPGIGHISEPLVKLKVRPNPSYRPPSRVEEILAGMQGFVLVDAARMRLAKVDGTLFKDVSFGWGILGHLDRGGHILIQQGDVGDNVWEISSLSLKFTGKILLVKSLSVDSTEVYSNFKRVAPNLTFAQGLELIKKEEPGGVNASVASERVRR